MKIKWRNRIGMVLFLVLLLFSMPWRHSDAARNLSGPEVDINSGLVVYHYVYMGYYPQSEISASELTDEITGAEYGSDGTAMTRDAVYKRIQSATGSYSYFLMEPVKWRVLENDGTYLTLQSARILDCMEYDPANDTAYDDSALRTWLNKDFLNAAFLNGASEGLEGVYGDDRITLLSEDDMENENYSMTTDNRVLTASDYAMYRGCYSADFTGNPSGAYWIRNNQGTSKYVDCIGEMHSKAASDADCGIAPVVKVSIDGYYYATENPVLKAPQVDTDNGTTLWNTVYFGSYPQTEMKNPDDSIINGTYKDDVAVVDGVRYKRVAENNTYRYFRFDAIRWRVLKKYDGKYLLQCDSIIEMYKSDTEQISSRYADSALSEWLNTYFYDTAFSGVIRENLIADSFGDYVDIISEDLLQSTEYGYQNDSSRKLLPSSYAEAVSFIGKEESAVCWFRSDEKYIDGYVNNQGSIIYYTPKGIKGICPVITLKEIPYVWGLSEDSAVAPPTETSGVPAATEGAVPPEQSPVPGDDTDHPMETPPALSTETPATYFTTKRPVVAVQRKSAGSQQLKWGRISGATGYCIYRSISKEGTYDLYSMVSGTSALVKNLKTGKRYYYVVIAYRNVNGELTYSRTSKVVSMKAGNPRKPQIIVSVTKNNRRKYVSIHWQNVSDAKYIQLYRSKNGRKYERILDARIAMYKKGVTVTYTYTKGSYYFKVRSYNRYKGKKLCSEYSGTKKVNL